MDMYFDIKFLVAKKTAICGRNSNTGSLAVAAVCGVALVVLRHG
jgi:hypothetical protein